MEGHKIEIAETGRFVLPFLANPVVKVPADKPFVVIEMTPIRNGKPTEAVCQIPMSQQDALRLATMIADLAFECGWPLPDGEIVKSRLQ